MATRLYFRALTLNEPGTYPVGEQSAATPSWTAAGATTNKRLLPTKGAAQGSHAGSSLASTSAQDSLLGMFVSPPLSGNQTVGGGNMILNAAEAESNTNMNFWVNSLNVYVWRPSTGAKIGTVRDAAGGSLGGTEPASASSEQATHITGITSSAISALDGDVIVVEVWGRQANQGMAVSYTGTFYFDGTTENTTENAAVSNHASFLELAETLTFKSEVRATQDVLLTSARSSAQTVRATQDVLLTSAQSSAQTVRATQVVVLTSRGASPLVEIKIKPGRGPKSRKQVGPSRLLGGTRGSGGLVRRGATFLPIPSPLSIAANITLTGLQTSSQVGSLSAEGEASTTLAGLEAQAQVGTVIAEGEGSTVLAGLEAAAQVGSVTAEGEASTTLIGLALEAQAGQPFAEGEATIDLGGLESASATGTVTAEGEGGPPPPPAGLGLILPPGRIRRKGIEIERRAGHAFLRGLETLSAWGAVRASAGARIQLQGLETRTRLAYPSARGVRNPSDDDFIRLLEAAE